MASEDHNTSEPMTLAVRDLARDLMLAQDAEDGPKKGRGRAVFLIGAGCSVSAGIAAGPGVARHCAVKLARIYSANKFIGANPDEALAWLIDNQRVTLRPDQTPKADGSHWGNLYQYFFEAHLKSANQQSDTINELVDAAGDRLNWAHACLGELVRLRYVHSVLTTNFDQLVLQGIIRTGLLPVVADGLESLNRITGRPKRPQVVHLHGSMHTYNLRNTSKALGETSQDRSASAMMFGLLQLCDLLVVVGYGGGEEGVMELLAEASKTYPQLVIYWVTYEQGTERLSSRCKTLLSGENKFAIWGGEADKFFGNLMSELGIGQPDWIADPIGVLGTQAKKLIAPDGDDFEDVRILVRAFEKRVDHAGKEEHRWPEIEETKVRAAEKRARGAFEEARAVLEQIDLSTDLEASRLHAVNAHSIFEKDPKNNRPMLEAAIREFSELVERTEDPERITNVLLLLNALSDMSEVEENDNPRGNSALNKIVEVTRQWLNTYARDENLPAWTQLKFYQAQALQVLAERIDEDVVKLQESEAAYNDAITGFSTLKDHAGDLIIAKAGLAGVLQVIGKKTKDVPKLRKAVELHREVVEVLRSNTQSKEDAGPLDNLGGSLIELAKVVEDPAEKPGLYGEARNALERAVRFYEAEGDAESAGAVRSRIEREIPLP